LSKHGIPIRLTDERWSHITEEHSELTGMRMNVGVFRHWTGDYRYGRQFDNQFSGLL